MNKIKRLYKLIFSEMFASNVSMQLSDHMRRDIGIPEAGK